MSKDELFSTSEMVLLCMEKCKEKGWISQSTVCLEPSSGDGIFYKYFNPIVKKMICMDIKPRHDECLEQDFLKSVAVENIDLIVGNPPFGRRNHLAVRFLNHACTLSNRCAFILPLSFLRPSTMDLISQSFWPVGFYTLPTLYFRIPDSTKTKKIGCGLFLWEKREEKRPLFKNIVDIKNNEPYTTSLEEAEYGLIHSGGSTGKIIAPGTYSKGTTYCLKGKKDIISKMDWSVLAKNGGAGQMSLCLTDIHLALKMKSMGLDYNTGALGYLENLQLAK